MAQTTRRALLVIDVQNDFCPGGALAVAEGDAVVAVANRLMQEHELVIATQDWHPAGHGSFASQHPGKQPYDQIDLHGVSQTLWPDHCVQGSSGAAFHPELDTGTIDLILRKGTQRDLDSYSAFFENDRRTATGLDGYLAGLEVRSVVVCGLATDYCVNFTALDAVRLGLDVEVVAAAVRGVDVPAGSAAAALDGMRRAGVRVT